MKSELDIVLSHIDGAKRALENECPEHYAIGSLNLSKILIQQLENKIDIKKLEISLNSDMYCSENTEELSKIKTEAARILFDFIG